MVLFQTHRHVYRQNGKVSPECHCLETVTYPRSTGTASTAPHAPLHQAPCTSLQAPCTSLQAPCTSPGLMHQSRPHTPVQASRTSPRLQEPVPGSKNQSQNPVSSIQYPVSCIQSALFTPRISLVDLKPAVLPHCLAYGGWSAGAVRGVRQVGYRVGAIPGTTQHPPSRLHWYCQDPTKPHTAVLRPPWHSRALQAPPHTMAPRTQYPTPGANMGEIQLIIS